MWIEKYKNLILAFKASEDEKKHIIMKNENISQDFLSYLATSLYWHSNKYNQMSTQQFQVKYSVQNPHTHNHSFTISTSLYYFLIFILQLFILLK